MRLLIDRKDLELLLEKDREYIGNNVGIDTMIAAISFLLSVFTANYSDLLGISGMAVSLLGGCWKNPVWFLGLLPGIFMLILAWSTRESIGYGDGLVILCMGCFYALGEMMAIVMIAITIAGIAALGLLIFGHKNRKSEFPFVPFLLGAHLVMWGIQR